MKQLNLSNLHSLRYKEGMLKARHGGDVETEQVVQSVAEGMLTITDTRGQDAVEDWEVDELLEWTNGLNFDQYVEQNCIFPCNSINEGIILFAAIETKLTRIRKMIKVVLS